VRWRRAAAHVCGHIGRNRRRRRLGAVVHHHGRGVHLNEPLARHRVDPPRWAHHGTRRERGWQRRPWRPRQGSWRMGPAATRELEGAPGSTCRRGG
jgi:hypothetical protein